MSQIQLLRRCRIACAGLGMVLLVACSSGLSGSGRGADSAPAAPRAGANAQAGSAASTPASGPVPLQTVHTAFSALVPSYALWWVAVEAGYFREQGLDADIRQIAGGPAMLAAMHNGEVHFVAGAAPEMVAGNLQGLETMVYGATMNVLEGVLFARPEIQTVQDLRGTTIGVTRPNSVTDISARVGLQRAGLQPDVDVSIIGTGGLAESVAAMDNRVIEGASLNVPFVFEARKRGFREVLSMTDLRIPFLQGAMAATNRVLTERPDAAEASLRAVAQAMRRVLTDREYAIDIMARYTRSEDRESLGATIDYYRPLFPLDLKPDPQGLQIALDMQENPAARTARPEAFIDMRFVERLAASGFLDQLPK
jgi:NitT/TauT family transport system substrate-binding protein